MLAADQRGAMRALLTSSLGRAPDFAEVCALKRGIVEGLAGEASAVLIDPEYGLPAVLPVLPGRTGLIVTVDASDYESTAGGRKTRIVADWGVGKAKRLGADAIKLLVFYHPLADKKVLDHQHDLLRRIGDDCARYDIAFMLEPLIYPMDTDQAAYARDRAQLVVDSTLALSDPAFQVDIYKLESPLPAVGLAGDAAGRTRLAELFELMTDRLPAPWVILSAAAAPEDFAAVLAAACSAGAGGYLAGRSIWKTAAEAFPDRQEMQRLLHGTCVPYMRELNALTDRLATPSPRQLALPLAAAPADFPAGYRGFDVAT